MEASGRILVVKTPPLNPHLYDWLLDRIERQWPELRPVFDVRVLPFDWPKNSNYSLCVPWLQDPLEQVSLDLYSHAQELMHRCDEESIPVINRLENHPNTGRVELSRRLTAAGIRTPMVRTIEPSEPLAPQLENLPWPMILRDNRGHQRPMMKLNAPEEVTQDLLKQAREPMLTEYVDTRPPEELLFRKYRALVMGNRVLTHHLQISPEWLTRSDNQIFDVSTREEELQFLMDADPDENTMLRVSSALELEYLAIDYGRLPSCNPIIWEANLFPYLPHTKVALSYRDFSLNRAAASLVLWYLELAGVEPPRKLVRQAAYD